MGREKMRIRYRANRERWCFDVYDRITDPNTGAVAKKAKKRTLMFPTKREAETERARLLAERQEFGRRAERLKPEERLEMVALRDRLAQAGATMNEAVEYFLANRPSAGQRVKFLEAVTEWRREKRDKVEPVTLQNYWHPWNQFAQAGFADRYLDTLTVEEVSEWLRTWKGWTPKTQLTYRANLSVLLGWAQEKGYVKANVARFAEIEREEVQTDVRRFTVGQVREYLQAAAEGDPDFVPYVVLSVFCGIRQEELADDRRDPNSGNPPVMVLGNLSEVAVMGAKKRSRRRRMVKLEDAPREWLRRYPAQCPVRPPVNWRRRWEAIRPEPWDQNAPRHTFATMHLAQFHDERRLQRCLGHADAELIHNTYAGLATEEEAAEFWSLTPEVVMR